LSIDENIVNSFIGSTIGSGNVTHISCVSARSRSLAASDRPWFPISAIRASAASVV
jgi:hypothetical protein